MAYAEDDEALQDGDVRHDDISCFKLHLFFTMFWFSSAFVKKFLACEEVVYYYYLNLKTKTEFVNNINNLFVDGLNYQNFLCVFLHTFHRFIGKFLH